VSQLRRKLARDLWRMRGQVLTIALVVMTGVASWVSTRATYDSLVLARDAYYEQQRFGDVFAECRHAPASVIDHLERIPSVTGVTATVIEPIVFQTDDPVRPTGVVLGVEVSAPVSVNAPRIKSGRLPAGGATDEAMLLESFATARGVRLGDEVRFTVLGVERRARVVGTAVSPEFLFALQAGEMAADSRQFGVLFMDLEAVRTLTARGGAINHVALSIGPGQSPKVVADAVDALLAPWGGVGATLRADQPSNRVLDQELGQLTGMALIVPAIFLAVAAFLLHTVLDRMVALERAEIAALRALGFSGLEIARHYLELTLAIAVVGAIFGVGLGAWLGSLMMDLYADYFHFPDPPFTVPASVVAVGVLVTLAAASAGALSSALRVARLPPAEAMRPKVPTFVRRSALERLGVSFGSPAARLVVRELSRRPGRVLLSAVGLSFAIAINVIGRFNGDVLESFMVDQFSGAMREDVSVTLRRTTDAAGLATIEAIPGVLRAEPLRAAPVELESGRVKRKRSLVGHPDGAELRRLVDRHGAPVAIPEHGVALDDTTAEALGVGPGDVITLRSLEGRRLTRRVRVAAVFDALTALEVHADLAEVERLTAEPGISAVLLSVEPGRTAEVRRRLYQLPEVLGVSERAELIARFLALTGATMTTMVLILTAFAAVIAVGVVYNDARITLSAQARELATLRVLGFSRREVSRLILAQIAVVVGLAVVPGLLLGRAGVELVASSVDPELYRFAVVVSPATYLASVAVVVAAASVSALMVRRRIAHLDLVEVLKTRD
jgi:putative ABC transport system permease protein